MQDLPYLCILVILSFIISLLGSAPLIEEAVKDTLSEAVIESSVKSVLPMERLASPVTVVFMNELEDRGIDNPKELSSLVPNLHIPDYGSSMTSSIYMRGFGSRMENPVLGLYIDDVPVLNKNAYDADMLDIRRVDLFRGPQGTLYGRNSMCGVLSLSTVSPSSYSGVRAAVEYGSANTAAARASAYGKTKEGLAIGGGIGFRHSDGFYKNGYTGDACDPYDGISMRLKMEKLLRNGVRFENIFSAGALMQGGWPYRQYSEGGLRPVSYNDECAYSRLNITEAVKMHIGKVNCTISSISALQMLWDRMDMDQDFTDRSMFTLTQIQREAALTQEVVLKPRQGWKTGWWDWQSGVFVFGRYNRMSAPVDFKQDGITDLILGNANSNIPEDIAGGFDEPLGIKEDNFMIGSEFGLSSFGAAIYHESYFDLGKWLFTLGARLDYEGGVMDYASDAVINYIFRPTMKDWKPFKTIYEGMTDNHYVEFLPKVSALYDFGSFGDDARASVFAVISKGYRSGGFNTQIFSDILQNMMMTGLMSDLGVYLDDSSPEVNAEDTAYRPEKAWNFEIGGNMEYGSFQFSGSIFHIVCRDQQITLFPPGKSTGRMMANVGRSRSLGAELSAAWSVENFRLAASYGFTDARFTDYFDGNNDYSGNRIPYSPAHTLDVRAGYSFHFASGFCRKVSLNAGCSGVGSIWWDEANTLYEPFRILVNADATIDFDRNISLRCRVENLTSVDYNVFYFKSIGNSFFQRGRPLRWTVGLSFNI